MSMKQFEPATGHFFPRLRIHVLFIERDTYCTWQHTATNPREVHPQLHMYNLPDGHCEFTFSQQRKFVEDLQQLEAIL